MTQNSNIKFGKINKLVITLGINANDIENIIEKCSITEENIHFSTSSGPFPYYGGYYGSSSIKDF